MFISMLTTERSEQRLVRSVCVLCLHSDEIRSDYEDTQCARVTLLHWDVFNTCPLNVVHNFDLWESGADKHRNITHNLAHAFISILKYIHTVPTHTHNIHAYTIILLPLNSSSRKFTQYYNFHYQGIHSSAIITLPNSGMISYSKWISVLELSMMSEESIIE